MWELHHEESWALKNWCFWTVVLEKTLWESFGLQRNSILKETSPKYSLEGLIVKLKLQYSDHLMWRTNSLEKILMLERLKAGEGDNRGWDSWMVSPTQWTWVWASSRCWWWPGKPGVLQFMGLQRVRQAWGTELNWLCYKVKCSKKYGGTAERQTRWKGLPKAKSGTIWVSNDDNNICHYLSKIEFHECIPTERWDEKGKFFLTEE